MGRKLKKVEKESQSLPSQTGSGSGLAAMLAKRMMVVSKGQPKRGGVLGGAKTGIGSGASSDWSDDSD